MPGVSPGVLPHVLDSEGSGKLDVWGRVLGVSDGGEGAADRDSVVGSRWVDVWVPGMVAASLGLLPYWCVCVSVCDSVCASVPVWQCVAAAVSVKPLNRT